MKIVIAGGHDRADFLIGSLLQKKHKLIVINEDKEYCEYLADIHGVPVVYGDPRKKYVLSDARIHKSDVLIAITSSDTDNLAICQMAKKEFSIKKAVCTVTNPKNVEIFKKLGVNTVISATYMLAKFIEQASTIENLIKTLSIEEKIIMSEVLLDEYSIGVNKRISDLNFPKDAIISCIIRGSEPLVPNGNTVLLPNDKLLIISSINNQHSVIQAVSRGH